MAQKYFDLSQPVYEKCPGWPTYELPSMRYEYFYPNDKVNAEQLTMNVHTGTHVDAPYHFFDDGATIDELPLDVFEGNAVIIDLCGIIAPGGSITVEHLQQQCSAVEPGDIVLINTRWCYNRGFSKEYFRDWPYMTGEAALFLRELGVKGVATDCISLGGWEEGTGRPCHETLLGAGIWIIEELMFPQEFMKHKKCHFMAFPIKLKGFSGAPTRAVATIHE